MHWLWCAVISKIIEKVVVKNSARTTQTVITRVPQDSINGQSMPHYVPRVSSPHTCLTRLRALLRTCLHFFNVPHVLSFLSALRTLIFYMPYVTSFFTSLTCTHFFNIPYVPSYLSCLHFLTCLYFLRAYISFMYILIKLTQINELTCDWSSLLLVNSVIYQRLSIIFTSVKLVSYSAYFFFFETKNINYF